MRTITFRDFIMAFFSGIAVGVTITVLLIILG